MRVSLNLIKKYADLPDDLSDKQIAYDLTLRTVEVENVIDLASKYREIVVGKIIDVKKHPNADKLKICLTDIGLEKPVQIVCGGTNLYANEFVVVAKPGALVYWHGTGEPVTLTETKIRGEASFGMICASNEVYLEEFFPIKDEGEIVDLKNIDCIPGQNIADLFEMNDTILEIDNKSLSNRPDLWGHYGIARELSAIYNVPLKPLDEFKMNKDIPEYCVKIEDTSKCNRFIAALIDGIYVKDSPMWLKSILIKTGQRPINAIVDITNYVMIAVGQPSHAYDKTHVSGEEIIVRNAHENEELLLLDNNTIKLTSEDLVICDAEGPLGLAGIRGGKKDSILPDTKGIVLEIANFSAQTIRKTGTRFFEKTEAAMRYEKGLDTRKVDEGLNLALKLIKEIFPDSKIVKFIDNYPNPTPKNKIEISERFLYERLGKEIPKDKIQQILESLGYELEYDNGIYNVTVPTWRSTGDVTIKDDVMGDIARILSYDSFEAKPLNISINSAVKQNKYLLERRIKEYLAYRCGFYEIYTYPWIDEKYLSASKIDYADTLKLASPPSPEASHLRNSLIPSMLEAIAKNLRYYNEFKIFEVGQVYKKGDYRPSIEEEILPIQEKYLTGCIVGENAKKLFFEAKGVLEEMAKYCHMEDISFANIEKPEWSDVNAHLNIIKNKEVIGGLGLLSIQVMNDAKIKRVNVAMFEVNIDKFVPFTSRTNKFEKLPELPLVEKDLSFIIDEAVNWTLIESKVKNLVKEVEFIDEYQGDQIPKGKKSITFKVKILNENSTMNSLEISEKMTNIIDTLDKECGAKLREE